MKAFRFYFAFASFAHVLRLLKVKQNVPISYHFTFYSKPLSESFKDAGVVAPLSLFLEAWNEFLMSSFL